MHRTATRFGLIVTAAVLAAVKVAAQQAASAAGPNAGGETEAAVKRVVDGIMQPYLAQEQRTVPRGDLWKRSPDLGAIVAVSLHGHRYFFPYGKATDAGAPFTPDTLLEIGSCTKTFTTTLFALSINRNQIVPDTSAQKYMPEGYAHRAQQLTPLGMADTTLRPTPEQQKRLTQGHSRAGRDAPHWPVYAWYAAGGLRSTAHAMISFGEANLGHEEVNGKPVPAELIAAMQLAQKPIYTMPNGSNKQAMAWVNNMGEGNPNLHPVIVKNGGTSGFGTVIAINPTKDAAIFIGMNEVGANPAVKGIEILRRLP